MRGPRRRPLPRPQTPRRGHRGPRQPSPHHPAIPRHHRRRTRRGRALGCPTRHRSSTRRFSHRGWCLRGSCLPPIPFPVTGPGATRLRTIPGWGIRPARRACPRAGCHRPVPGCFRPLHRCDPSPARRPPPARLPAVPPLGGQERVQPGVPAERVPRGGRVPRRSLRGACPMARPRRGGHPRTPWRRPRISTCPVGFRSWSKSARPVGNGCCRC